MNSIIQIAQGAIFKALRLYDIKLGTISTKFVLRHRSTSRGQGWHFAKNANKMDDAKLSLKVEKTRSVTCYNDFSVCIVIVIAVV